MTTIKLPVEAELMCLGDDFEWHIVDADGVVVGVDDIVATLNATATPAMDGDRLPSPATELDIWEARCHGIAVERCPFCDGVADVWSLLRDGYATTPDDPDARAYWSRCRACGCNGGWSKSESGARRWWSMRVQKDTTP